MCNFHPDLYVWLCENFEKEPEKADVLQSALSMAAFTEALAYPVTAKYHLKEIIGLPLSDIFTRKRPAADLTEYNVLCIRQMELLAEEMRKLIR